MLFHVCVGCFRAIQFSHSPLQYESMVPCDGITSHSEFIPPHDHCSQNMHHYPSQDKVLHEDKLINSDCEFQACQAPQSSSSVSL